MFRNRTSSKKPGDDFIATFRQSFPEIAVATSGTGINSGGNAVGEVTVDDLRFQRQQSVRGQAIKGLDATLRPQFEQWQLTPSILDPNSFAFSTFANQPPGYDAPIPGGTNTLYDIQASDLYTPVIGIGIGLGAPLSMPASADSMHPSTMMDLSASKHHLPFQFHFFNSIGHHQHHENPHQQQPQQHSYAPSSFIHQETEYDIIDYDGGLLATLDACRHQSDSQGSHYDTAQAAQPPALAEKFRFHVTLNAPTAMIKHADEIPVTYLNKGQTYSVSIVDTAPQLTLTPGARYRTLFRILFDDDQQRQRPGPCWQLWKERSGTNEAHPEGGQLQAVEYVEANRLAESDDKRTRVELEAACFDGFTVIWTPDVHGATECKIAVRFNFLSTDFSHSKGVKGISVRFCAKTQIAAPGSLQSSSESSEVAYCKIKLFRDYGSERKLSNDVAYIKKRIDKLKQQVPQAVTGVENSGEKKQVESNTKAQPSQRYGKVQKHKRKWSISSASATRGQVSVVDDLYCKLQTMQDMFNSSRQASILYLRGAEQDDPDLCPLALVGEPVDLTKMSSKGSVIWQQRSDRSSTTDSVISTSPSSITLHSQNCGAPTSRPLTVCSPSDELTKVQRADEYGSLSGWIEVSGVCSSYTPPQERPIKPVACFYILRRDPTQPGKHEYHRAIYVMQRTLKDFTKAIARKYGLEPIKVLSTRHVLERGFEIEINDNTVREMIEGQDMILEIVETRHELPKRDFKMSIDVAVDSDDANSAQQVEQTEGYELRLIF